MGCELRQDGEERSPGEARAAAIALAAHQHGRITRTQLAQAGVGPTRTDAWVRDGRLLARHRGVYAFAPLQDTREGGWMEAALACGSRAMLGGLSGAAHLRIVSADGDRPDVLAPRSCRGHPGINVHRLRRLPPSLERDRISVARAPWLLIDLARRFADGPFKRAVNEADLHGLLDEIDLQRALAENRGRPGTARLARLLEIGLDEIPRNAMEEAFAAIVAGLPCPVPEMHVRLLGYEIDFLWRELRIAVEADGRTVHQRRLAFGHDRRKDRALQLADWLPLRFTYAEIVHQPGLVAGELCAAFALRAAAA